MMRLRELREDRKLTQQQLADRVVPKTSQAQVDRLEKGQRKLTKEWAMRLSGALDCHWTELMGDDQPRLTEREKQMLGLFRGLSEREQEAFVHLADTIAKPGTRPEEKDD